MPSGVDRRLGAVLDVEDFVPLEVSKVDGDMLTSDPMFADYGGLEQRNAIKRWHLPEHLAREAEAAVAVVAEDVAPDADVSTVLRAALRSLDRA